MHFGMNGFQHAWSSIKQWVGFCKFGQRSLEKPKVLCQGKGERWGIGREKNRNHRNCRAEERPGRGHKPSGEFSKAWPNFTSVILSKSCTTIFTVTVWSDAIILTCPKPTGVWVQPCFEAPPLQGCPLLDSPPPCLSSPSDWTRVWGRGRPSWEWGGGSVVAPHKGGEGGKLQEEASLWWRWTLKRSF